MSDVIGVGCDVAEMTLCRGAGWRNLLPSTAPQDESQVSHTGGTKVQAHSIEERQETSPPEKHQKSIDHHGTHAGVSRPQVYRQVQQQGTDSIT